MNTSIIKNVKADSIFALRKAFAIAFSDESCLSINVSKDEQSSEQFAQQVDFLVRKHSSNEFKKGNKGYAFGMRYLRNMLVQDGLLSSNINGFTTAVSKQLLNESLNRLIELSHSPD
jgi:hypothetical protein